MSQQLETTRATQIFHPIIQDWFEREVGAPTDAQRQAWPAIARGEHVLLTAPTGSGKTLSAFLWAIQNIFTGTWPGGHVRVLYVSPLKALNNDIKENLLGPLSALESAFSEANETHYPVRVMTRSGDTPPGERQRMYRRPPEILITTPESLNILLTSNRGAALFHGLTTVILDEIHAVAGRKRGVHLITAVERLVPICGEFQRIVLSATVNPLDRIADFAGGYRPIEEKGKSTYEKRPVTILRAKDEKKLDFGVRAAAGALDIYNLEEQFWDKSIEYIKEVVERNRSTIVFGNSRRLVENVAGLLNEDDADHPTALAHHGSLSKEIRRAVEKRLKSGTLPCIVSTSTLELGIDIGSVDEVLMIQTPPSISATLQRVGRAGHGVGDTSRGQILPTYPRDTLDAAIMTQAVLDRDIEPEQPPENALDVLAQVVLSILCSALPDELTCDEVYDTIRRASVYHRLRREDFDLVIEMLGGRYAGTRIRELRPRLTINDERGTIRARPAARHLLYQAGGTIPERGLFELRLLENDARIGELDEEFVWERRIGDIFLLGNQQWKIERITHSAVYVSRAYSTEPFIPFWRGDGLDRSFHFSEKVSNFLEGANDRLKDPGFRDELLRLYRLDKAVADMMLQMLIEQKRITGRDLPHRHHVLIETVGTKVMIHTPWGGRVNRPLAIAMRAAYWRRFSERIQTLNDNDGILLTPCEDFKPAYLSELVTPDNIEELLRDELESNGFFGARFRENSGIALLLPPRGYRSRVPLWFNRMRARKIFEAVQSYKDFPILIETWRQCLRDEFEVDQLKSLLGEIQDGKIRITTCRSEHASPFAQNLMHEEIDVAMYADDAPERNAPSALDEELLRHVVFNQSERPRISAGTLNEFLSKLQRTARGYAPTTPEALTDWVGERVFLRASEWAELAASMTASGVEPGTCLMSSSDLLSFRFPNATERALSTVSELASLANAFQLNPGDLSIASPQELVPEGDIESHAGLHERVLALSQRKRLSEESVAGHRIELLGRFLSFYGPVQAAHICESFGFDEEHFARMAAEFVNSGQWIRGCLLESDDVLLCDSQNYESLLRLNRRRNRPVLEPWPITALPALLALVQGIAPLDVQDGDRPDDLPERMRARVESLMGYPARVRAWEETILPFRGIPNAGPLLDDWLRTGQVVWMGQGAGRITFAFSADLALFPVGNSEESLAIHRQLFPDPMARYAHRDIVLRSKNPQKTESMIWDLVWAGRITGSDLDLVRRRAREEKKSQTAHRTSLRRRPSLRARPHPFRADMNDYTWKSLHDSDVGDEMSDAVDQDELVKDRARVLLARYGVVFRELLERETKPLRWSTVFRQLRLMELAGEISAGYFIEGVPGLQFASTDAIRLLRHGVPNDYIFGLNATDPASVAGIPLDALRDTDRPRRIPGNFMVYHGPRLVLIARRRGELLEIRTAPGDVHIKDYLRIFKVMLHRGLEPPVRFQVREINGVTAFASEYQKDLVDSGFQRDYDRFVLHRRYDS